MLQYSFGGVELAGDAVAFGSAGFGYVEIAGDAVALLGDDDAVPDRP